MRTYRLLAPFLLTALGVLGAHAGHADAPMPSPATPTAAEPKKAIEPLVTRLSGPASDMGGLGGSGGLFDPHLLVQTQAALYTDPDNQQARGDRAEHPGFTLRRARVGFSGRYERWISYGLYADVAGNPQAAAAGPLSEAWLGIDAWRGGQIVIGAHRTPYSQNALLGSGHLALIERPLAITAMAPFRQVGVTFSGQYPQFAGLQWYAGVYNGFERGTNFYEGIREYGGVQGNRFGGLSAVGRVAIAPLGDLGPQALDSSGGGLRVQAGVSAYQSLGSTARMNGLSADLHLKFHGIHLLAEYLQDGSEPRDQPTTAATLPASLKRRALLVEGGYRWRAFNAAVRWEQIDPDTAREDDRDESVLSTAIGMQEPGQKLRVQLQYDHRHESIGPTVVNDTVFAQFQLML